MYLLKTPIIFRLQQNNLLLINQKIRRSQYFSRIQFNFKFSEHEVEHRIKKHLHLIYLYKLKKKLLLCQKNAIVTNTIGKLN